MSDLYIEARLQAIKDIASASCADEKDADNIAGFCDEIYSAIPNLDKIVKELELHSFELGTDLMPKTEGLPHCMSCGQKIDWNE